MYNTKVKIYKDGTTNAVYCSEPVFGSKPKTEHTDDYYDELIKKYDENGNEIPYILAHPGNYCVLPFEEKRQQQILAYYEREKRKREEEKENEPRADNVKRAIDKVYDIVMQNDFTHFLTLTIDPEEFDRTDPQKVIKKLTKWLNNMQQRKGLIYLLIPEYHEKGGIHCHALINDVLTFEDSGRRLFNGKAYKIDTLKRKGLYWQGLKPVYNIKEWKYGYTTAIPLDGERMRVAHYVTKYITKDVKKIFGKFYWSSRSLCREVDTKLMNVDYAAVNKVEYEPKRRLGIKFKYDLQPIGHEDNTDIIPPSRDFDKPPEIDYGNIPWE